MPPANWKAKASWAFILLCNFVATIISCFFFFLCLGGWSKEDYMLMSEVKPRCIKGRYSFSVAATLKETNWTSWLGTAKSFILFWSSLLGYNWNTKTHFAVIHTSALNGIIETCNWTQKEMLASQFWFSRYIVLLGIWT
jgi:hypothetical protein